MDEKLLRIILAGWGLLVKTLITLKPHYIFSSNLTYLYIFEADRVNDKEKKKVTPGFKPLYIRLLDYKKTSLTTLPLRI